MQSGRGNFWKSGWPESLASVLAFTGLLAAVFNGFNPYLRQNAGSDFKTLYASAWCSAHGFDAYQFSNLAVAFRVNHVVEPVSWYGHAPVYPLFTLVLLAPLTKLAMVPALIFWIMLSGVLMAWAAVVLARAAGRIFGLPVWLRLLLVGLVACSPLLSLGMELGNVSVVVVALSILALTVKPEARGWPAAIGLSIALLLKPHIAFWMLLSLLLSRTPVDMRVLKKTVLITGCALGLILIGTAINGSLLPQTASYRAMLVSELSNGSMSPGNRDLLEIEVQITSFAHLVGYLLRPGLLPTVLNIVVLAGLGIGIAWGALRFRRAASEPRYVIAPAVFGFGLMATYHREADSTMMLLLLPFLLWQLYSNWRDAWAWLGLALLAAGSLGPSLAGLRWLAEHQPGYAAVLFVALRQAALAGLCLTLWLIVTLATGKGYGTATDAIRKREFA